MSIYSYLQEQTFESLRDRMLELVPADIDKSENSFIYTAIAPVAMFVSDMLSIVKMIMDESFIMTATGQNLDNIAATFPRVYRRGATKERITAKIVGANVESWLLANASGANVYFTNDDGDRFVIDSERGGYQITTDGANVYLSAETAGMIGSNIGDELKATPDLEAESCSVASIESFGAEVEDDKTFRYRVWSTLNSPFSGTLQDYYKMVFADFPTSNGGYPIDYAFIQPRGSSSGKIFVYAARKDDEGNPNGLTHTELNTLQEYLDKRISGVGGYGLGAAPIGHHVYAKQIPPYRMRLHVDLTFSQPPEIEWAVLHEAVKKGTNTYLNALVDQLIPKSDNFFIANISSLRRSIHYSVNDHASAIYEELRKLIPNNVKIIRSVVIYKKLPYFSTAGSAEENARYLKKYPDGVWIRDGEYKTFVVKQKDFTLSTTRNGKIGAPRLENSIENITEENQLLYRALSIRVLIKSE